MEAIDTTKVLNRVPLIGFAGSPWTILCYCVRGQGSRTLIKQEEFCFKPEAAHSAGRYRYYDCLFT
jgi:uroporphyrinogen decarboxylase